jgi:hypothetical protein
MQEQVGGEEGEEDHGDHSVHGEEGGIKLGEMRGETNVCQKSAR